MKAQSPMVIHYVHDMERGHTSVLPESIPAVVLTPTAVLREPPTSIAAAEILPEVLPNAWSDEESTALDYYSNTTVSTLFFSTKSQSISTPSPGPCGTRTCPFLSTFGSSSVNSGG
jgi:hypothetical protein